MAYDEEIDKQIATARKRVEQARAAQLEQRAQSKTDLEFRVNKQWNEKTKQDRIDAGRPALTINLCNRFVNQVVNDVYQNKPSCHVDPKKGPATKPTAEVYEGMVRSILYDSEAETGIDIAADYQISSGEGHVIVEAELIDEETNQQALRVNPIHDPTTIYWDPFARRYDRKDAKWCVQLCIMSRLSYEAKLDSGEWKGSDDYKGMGGKAVSFTGDGLPPLDWSDPNGDQESIIVAKYWCVEEGKFQRVAFDDDSVGWDDIVPEGRTVKGAKGKPRNRRVICHIINGIDELEEPIVSPGKWIPIVSFYGPMTWVDGKLYIGSLIRDVRDLQVLYNWEATNEAEALGMMPRAPYMLTPEMVQGHEGKWQKANNANTPYLLVNADPLMPGWPQRQEYKAPLDLFTVAKQGTSQTMKDVIGMQDPSLGKASSADQSGFAIGQLRSEGDLSTFHYLNNIRRSIRQLCRILVDLIPFYYDIEQEVRILGEDMKAEIVMVNTTQPIQQEDGSFYHHQLDVGEYEVVVSDEPAYATARKESREFYSSLAANNPEAAEILMDLILENSDLAGADAAAERWKRFLAIKYGPSLIGKPGEAIPPAAQGQIAQLQDEVQKLSQSVQEMGMVIKTKQIEQQGRIAVEKTKQQTAIITNSAKIAAAGHSDATSQKHELHIAHLEGQLEAAKHLAQMHHEHSLIDHEGEQAHSMLAHQGAQAHAQATQQGEQEHSVIAHQAAVAPPPVAANGKSK